jgi:hypothetical protein
MSNFLAIGTVSATVGRMLQAVLDVDVPGARVTTNRPEDPNSNTRDTGLNIYLYQVSSNTVWRNSDLPARRFDGTVCQRPQAALDLHYLFSFYGDESKLEPQRMLGSVVRTLHSQPMITRRAIQNTITDPKYSCLAGSDLADGVERVKFTPLTLSLEELSKLWSVFFQVPYTLSAIYQATVVLIDSQEVPGTALPVRDYNVYVLPFEQPVVEKVIAAEGEREPIISRSTLRICGRRLLGDMTRIRLAGMVLTPRDVDLGEKDIAFSLTQAPAGQLRSGVQPLQVVHDVLMGTPPVPHHGFESNVAAFVLRPSLVDSHISGSDLHVHADPVVGLNQRPVLLLNEFNAPTARPALAYTIEASSHDGTAAVSISVGASNADPTLNELGFASPTPVSGVYSLDLAAFTGLSLDPAKVLVMIGAEGLHEASLTGSPVDLDAAAASLENGIRAAYGSAAFSGARVIRRGNRLLALSGTAGETLSFAPAGNDPALNELGLSHVRHVNGVFSEDLSGFAGLTNDPAKIQIKFGREGPHDVCVTGAPADLDAAATALENGIRAARTGSAFAAAGVVRVGNRLLIVHGARTLSFSIKEVSSGDYLVRLQVDGAESPLEIDAGGRYNKPRVTIP